MTIRRQTVGELFMWCRHCGAHNGDAWEFPDTETIYVVEPWEPGHTFAVRCKTCQHDNIHYAICDGSIFLLSLEHDTQA